MIIKIAGRMLGVSAFLLSGCTQLGSPLEAADTPHFDVNPPEITQWMQQPAMLVFSKTEAWRHNEGIAGADLFLTQLSREQGYGIFTTVNGAVFNADALARFDVIVFNNMTGDALSPKQEAAFQTWLETGGAWIGLHGAGDNSHLDWSWYSKTVIGPEFIGHPQNPQFNVARVVNLDSDHAIMADVPESWLHNEEWYSFDGVPQNYGLKPLAGIEEATIWPEGASYDEEVELRMGATPIEHAVMWTGCIGAGRTFYSALGHSDQAYEGDVNRQILTNAFDWVQKKTDPNGEGCP